MTSNWKSPQQFKILPLIFLLFIIIAQFDEFTGWRRRRSALAFEVLPYVHIDFSHYLRLAECQAKCSKKYGVVTDRLLLDGSSRPHLNTSTDLYEICEMGCTVHLRSSNVPSRKESDRNDDGSVFEAFSNGQNFWWASAVKEGLKQGKSDQKHQHRQAHHQHLDQNLIDKIRVLCIEKSPTTNGHHNLRSLANKRRSLINHPSTLAFNTFDAILTADLREELRMNKSSANFKYVVQWRQKQVVDGNKAETVEEETKWITASIEPTYTFKVRGLQPGIAYKFMITVVSATGRQSGESSKSSWIDFEKLFEGTQKSSEKAALSINSQYNLENNVGAVVRWVQFNDIFKSILPPNHPQLFPTPTTESAKESTGHDPLLFEGCQLQIEYANKTTKVVEEFTIDESDGFLIKNLGFHSEYSVEIRPKQSLLAESHGFQDAGMTTNHLNGKFLSMSCSQVYGQGSLECEPEPVQDVQVVAHPENGTVTVKWTPSAEVHHILLYQLYYLPTSESVDCALEPTSLFLTANSTSASLQMPTVSICEFELRLVHYDLLGREATTSKHFVFTPKSVLSTSTSMHLTQQTTAFLIGLFVMIALALFLIVKFATFWPRRLKRVALASTNSTNVSGSSSPMDYMASKVPKFVDEV